MNTWRRDGAASDDLSNSPKWTRPPRARARVCAAHECPIGRATIARCDECYDIALTTSSVDCGDYQKQIRALTVGAFDIPDGCRRVMA
jgi:hypothetical protein